MSLNSPYATNCVGIVFSNRSPHQLVESHFTGILWTTWLNIIHRYSYGALSHHIIWKFHVEHLYSCIYFRKMFYSRVPYDGWHFALLVPLCIPLSALPSLYMSCLILISQVSTQSIYNNLFNFPFLGGSISHV